MADICKRISIRLLIALAIIMSLQSRRAAAGPVEEFKQILLHPNDPNVLIARWAFGGAGLFYSSDRGKSWSIMCSSMIAPGERADGAMALTGDSAVLLGFFSGLWDGRNAGCMWTKTAMLEGARVTDVTLHPTDPMVAFAVTGNGNPGSLNGVYQRTGDGSWTKLGTQDETIINRVRVVTRGAGVRIYQSAQRGVLKVGDPAVEVPNYLLRLSDDMGVTWTETAVSVEKGSFRLEAVDPSNPDRLVLSINNATGTDVVLVSSDQGKTMTEFFTATDLRGVTLAPDGRIWIADFGDSSNPTIQKGIFFAANLSSTPSALVSDYQVACVTYDETSDTLYTCQRWKAGSVDVKTGAFSELASFVTARDFISCDGMDSAATCKTQLCNDWCGPMHFATAPLCSAYSDPACGPMADALSGPAQMGAAGSGANPASGNGSAAAGAGAPATTRARDAGGGCSTIDGSRPMPLGSGSLAPLALGTAALLLRRRYWRTRLQIPS